VKPRKRTQRTLHHARQDPACFTTDMTNWTTAAIPNLTGRRVIVTGANSGIGFETAKALTAKGAAVTLAVRDSKKGEHAAAAIGPLATPMQLDLTSLDSVREFAAEWSAQNPEGLDLLINNAGIMAIPRAMTVDGFEAQLATNHLGHFALTGLLVPALAAVPNSRVVTVSSLAHKMVKGMNFDDLMGAKKYRAWNAYGQSKLANLLFTSELQRRLTAGGYSTIAVAAHPGFTSTNLQGTAAKMKGNVFEFQITEFFSRRLGQDPTIGALPTLFAATAPGLPGDSYVGPKDLMQSRGYPVLVDRSAAAQDISAAKRLWDVSTEITGVEYPL
jgi:NAD(P)-dependent dehydrogenase (short-subunit alcohol dehydrogenase family)